MLNVHFAVYHCRRALNPADELDPCRRPRPSLKLKVIDEYDILSIRLAQRVDLTQKQLETAQYLSRFFDTRLLQTTMNTIDW